MYIYLKFKIILLKITHPPRNKVNLEIFFSIITNIIISIIGLWNTLLCIESFVPKRMSHRRDFCTRICKNDEIVCHDGIMQKWNFTLRVRQEISTILPSKLS